MKGAQKRPELLEMFFKHSQSQSSSKSNATTVAAISSAFGPAGGNASGGAGGGDGSGFTRFRKRGRGPSRELSGDD
jgi:hypothetical protein